MHIRKSRWSRVYESAEEELIELLERRRIAAQRWAADDGEDIIKQFAGDTQIWCAEGQLACTVGGQAYSLQPGDILSIPAKMKCTIHVGFGGCVCYESTAVRTALS